MRERSAVAYFDDPIIPYGFDPLDAPCDICPALSTACRELTEAAQLNDPLVSFDTDLE